MNSSGAPNDKSLGSSWYYADNEKPYGPISTSQLLDLMKRGSINQETLVWAENWENWVPLGEVSERLITSLPQSAPRDIQTLPNFIDKPSNATAQTTAEPQAPGLLRFLIVFSLKSLLVFFVLSRIFIGWDAARRSTSTSGERALKAGLRAALGMPEKTSHAAKSIPRKTVLVSDTNSQSHNTTPLEKAPSNTDTLAEAKSDDEDLQEIIDEIDGAHDSPMIPQAPEHIPASGSDEEIDEILDEMDQEATNLPLKKPLLKSMVFTDSRWTEGDIQGVAEKLAKQVLKMQWVTTFRQTKKQKPVVVSDQITNRTAVIIDIDYLARRLNVEFLSSGKVSPASPEKRQQLLQNIRKKSAGIEADMLLTGSISSFIDRQSEVTTYEFSLTLTDLVTGKIVGTAREIVKKRPNR